MSSSILHPVQYRFLNNGCIHWNTTKSPTQQKSGYLVSSTAFWIADFFWSCFFGNQEVYHVFLGNMIKTILKPTKITISSCFFLPQKSWGWDSSKQPVPASGSHHLFSCMQLYAKALACDEAAACVKLLVGWPADVVPVWSSFQMGGFNHKFLVD